MNIDRRQTTKECAQNRDALRLISSASNAEVRGHRGSSDAA